MRHQRRTRDRSVQMRRRLQGHLGSGRVGRGLRVARHFGHCVHDHHGDYAVGRERVPAVRRSDLRSSRLRWLRRLRLVLMWLQVTRRCPNLTN